jgi:hypothetical protein
MAIDGAVPASVSAGPKVLQSKGDELNWLIHPQLPCFRRAEAGSILLCHRECMISPMPTPGRLFQGRLFFGFLPFHVRLGFFKLGEPSNGPIGLFRAAATGHGHPAIRWILQELTRHLEQRNDPLRNKTRSEK